MKDEELDTLIDEIARQMTAGEPGAAFTSNVLARVDERRASWSPALAARVSWRAAGLAAAAVLLLATTIVFRSHRAAESGAPTIPAGPEAARASDVRLTPDTTIANRGSDATRLAPAPNVGPPSTMLRPGARDAARPDEPLASDIDALTVPSIAIDQLKSAPLEPAAALDTDPLTIAPLVVAPIEGADDTSRRFE